MQGAAAASFTGSEFAHGQHQRARASSAPLLLCLAAQMLSSSDTLRMPSSSTNRRRTKRAKMIASWRWCSVKCSARMMSSRHTFQTSQACGCRLLACPSNWRHLFLQACDCLACIPQQGLPLAPARAHISIEAVMSGDRNSDVRDA